MDVLSNRSLKGASIRAVWGSPNSGIAVINDDEIIVTSGCRLVIHKISERKSIVMSHHQQVTCMHSFAISPNKKILAVPCRLKTDNPGNASMLLYDVDSQYTSAPRSARTLTFGVPDGLAMDSGSDFKFVSSTFSFDSGYIACTTHCCGIGILIFDSLKGVLIRQIPMSVSLSMASFALNDVNKLCTSGSCSTFQFWRINSKVVNAAPISGNKAFNSYTLHTWVSDQHVVSATTSGSLCVSQGCDLVFSISFADVNDPCYVANQNLVSILFRGDMVIAVSGGNAIYLFEFKRMMSASAHGPTAVLLPMARFRIAEVDHICGVQWAVGDSRTSYELLLSCDASIMSVDLNSTEATKLAFIDGGSASTTESAPNPRQFALEKGANCSHLEWSTVRPKQVINSFHSATVSDLSISTRTCMISSLSVEEESIRVRDFNRGFGQEAIIESMAERPDESPLCLCMHPSGLYLVTGTDEFLIEYAIGDAKLEMIKKISMKVPYNTSAGVPIVNVQPVSLVKYSNGGHLLVAVTGRIAQVFHVYSLDFANAEVKGNPRRVMVLTEHTAAIISLSFSADDRQLFTSSADGSVYGWTIGKEARDSDYHCKGLVATSVVNNISRQLRSSALSPIIVASFETPLEWLVPSSRGRSPSSKRLTSMSSRKNVIGNAGIPRTAEASPKHFDANLRSLDGETCGATNSMAKSSSAGSASKQHLAIWKQQISPSPELLLLDVPCSAIALGFMVDGIHEIDIAVLGLADGRVIISGLPLPIRVLSMNIASAVVNSYVAADVDSNVAIHSAVSNDKDSSSPLLTTNFFDDMQCKIFNLHQGRVNSVRISASGLWVFSGGSDGATFMLSSSLRGKEFTDIPEYSGFLENTLTITEKAQLVALRTRMSEVDTLIEDTRQDSERAQHKIIEQKALVISEIESRMKREVQKRDNIIVQSREDYARLSKLMKDEISSLKRSYEDKLSTTELNYEKKLAMESLYLDKMKQAYDEYVVHARMDLKEAHSLADKRVGAVEESKTHQLSELDKQKRAVMMYVDFAGQRYQETMKAMEEAHANERSQLKKRLQDHESDFEELQRQSRTDTVQMSMQIQRMRNEMSSKEEETLRLTSDLQWAKGRIQKLEATLQQAANDLKKRQEACEKLEFKSGDQQQQISELDRIRRTLTSQLHTLRQEIGPKEERLLHLSEKLQEYDREYEVSLQAISDKESQISKQGESLHLLQKQVRDLRRQTSNKEAILRRCAKLFDDYKFCLRESHFHSIKRTMKAAQQPNALLNDGVTLLPDNSELPIEPNFAKAKVESMRLNETINKLHPTSDVVELFVKSESMDRSLKAIDDLMKHFLIPDHAEIELENEAMAQRAEQERHMLHLHKSVHGLRANVELATQVASAKVANHLRDNQLLLNEVNSLRHEIRSLSMENQRLLATLEFNDRKMRESQLASGDRISRTGSRDSSSSAVFTQKLQSAVASSGFNGANNNVTLSLPNDHYNFSIDGKKNTTGQPHSQDTNMIHKDSTAGITTDSAISEESNITSLLQQYLPQFDAQSNSSNPKIKTSSSTSSLRAHDKKEQGAVVRELRSPVIQLPLMKAPSTSNLRLRKHQSK